MSVEQSGMSRPRVTGRRRLLLISEFFPPRTFGGGETSAFLLARGLADRGFEVTVLTSKAAGLADDTPAEDVVRAQGVLERIAEGLKAHNAKNPGSSTQIHRAILLAEPPSLDAGELTDKGYINQSVSLSRRADKVAKLRATLDSAVADALIVANAVQRHLLGSKEQKEIIALVQLIKTLKAKLDAFAEETGEI